MSRKNDRYKNMSDETFLRPGPKEPFNPVDNDFCEVHWGATPSGGDLSIAYFYDENRCPCRREDAMYMNIVEYTKDGTRINEHNGQW